MSEERAKIAANNRSLRIIKNELEALCERNFITDDQYDRIISALPAEASLHGNSVSTPAPNLHNTTSPAPSIHNTASPVAGFAAMPLNDRTSNATPNNPPPLYSAAQSPPPRNGSQHVEVGHAVALYRYHDADPRDLNFEVGDHISVMEYTNADWWMGKNIRTGEEGIFPQNYVRKENFPSELGQKEYSSPSPPVAGYYGNDQKRPTYGQPQPAAGYYGQATGQYGPSNPYNGPVPPMQVAEQPMNGQPGKGQEMGKKFGRKLGNAAIFGAGATIGSSIVGAIL